MTTAIFEPHMVYFKSSQFQTPSIVCDVMASMVVPGSRILEPTPGDGNLVNALITRNCTVITPKENFWDMEHLSPYDYVVMNPPFTPILHGFKYLEAAMSLSNHIIALLPWLVLINSEKRMKCIMDWGLVSLSHLPRKTFPNSRIQCVILEMDRTYKGLTSFHHITW